MLPTSDIGYSTKLRLSYLALAGGACMLGFILLWLGGETIYREFPVDEYLIFHLITEFASIIVSFAVFTVGWYGYKQEPNSRNLAIALTFFAVGLIDFFHALSYGGMPDFLSANSVSKAATYWIAARLVFSAGLFVVVIIPSSQTPGWLHPRLLLAAVAAAILALILVETYAPGAIPAMFIEGQGLTQLKNILEYIVIGLNAATIIVLWKKPVFGNRSSLLLQLALVVSIFSEVAFTLYASAYDSFNLLGHAYKVAAYYLILRAIFVSALQQPYLELSKTRTDLERSFNSIGQALSSSRELDKTLKLIAEIASDVLGYPHAMVALKQPDSDSLEVCATRGVSITPTEIPLKDSLAASVCNKNEPIWIDDLTTEPSICRVEMPDGAARSAIAAPIVRDSKILGVIAVFSKDAGVFRQPDANLLAAFARHASLAIENANLYEKQVEARAMVQNYAVQLSILHNISLTLNTETDRTRLLETILKAAAELTSAGVGVMTLYDDGKVELGPVYYAPWFDQRCAIGAEPTRLHNEIVRLTETAKMDTIRIDDLNGTALSFNFPAGHIGLRGLLIGTVRGPRNQIKGSIILSDKVAGSNFTPEDGEIISLLSAQSSVALISAENFEREHIVAETLQASLLPSVPERKDMEVGLLYRSAGMQGRVGGDFYDFIELGKNKIAIAVGDVCGKGLEAATYTAMIKYMLRAYLEEGLFPGDCLTRLNHSVHKEVSIDKFITVGLALIDTSSCTVTYASAGHPPPLICQENSANPLHIPHGIPLGVLANRKFLSSQIAPVGSCTIVMYTDGLIEARPDGGAPMGQDRLCSTLSKLCNLPASQLVDKLLEAAVKYSGGTLKDDIAILAVKLQANPEIRM